MKNMIAANAHLFLGTLVLGWGLTAGLGEDLGGVICMERFGEDFGGVI